jgi:hypothetical protein
LATATTCTTLLSRYHDDLVVKKIRPTSLECLTGRRSLYFDFVFRVAIPVFTYWRDVMHMWIHIRDVPSSCYINILHEYKGDRQGYQVILTNWNKRDVRIKYICWSIWWYGENISCRAVTDISCKILLEIDEVYCNQFVPVYIVN